MKKMISLILALCMVFALCACGSKSNASNTNLSAAYDKIMASLDYDDSGLPVLKVATSPDFAPMEFTDLDKEGDQIVGFDIILAKYLGKELNVKIEICPMSFDACMAAVQTGTVDMAMSGFSWTEDRAENFLITDWYKAGENESEQAVITLAGKGEALAEPSDFSGLKVGAQGGSLQKQLTEETLVPEGAECVLYENLNDAVTALLTGKIDAISVAVGNGDAFISANDGKIEFTSFQYDVPEKYKNNVILINKNNQELFDLVNPVLINAKADGCKMYDEWYDACKVYAGISSLDELGYDDDGNKITG